MSARFKSPAAEESVACNLIPMIDIMFLLLLFFMLGADMTQRELEEVALPAADRCEKDPLCNLGGPGRTTVNVFHQRSPSGFTCPVHERGGICRELDHWRIAIRAKQYTLDSVASRLAEDASLELEDADPRLGGKRLSAREVMIRSDRDAPYALIQKVLESCATVGLYKIAVGAVRPEARG